MSAANPSSFLLSGYCRYSTTVTAGAALRAAK